MKRLALLAGIFWFLTACSNKDWRSADRSSAGIAPKASELTEAIIQIYAARAFEWRGNFAVHTWISVKERDAENYIVYQVVGWRIRQGKSALSIEEDLPDRRWYDAEPYVLYEIRGERAAELIPGIDQAAKNYPYPDTYRAWPGPNSNTFVSYILRENPSIGVELPPHAIGKDWLKDAAPFAITETGTGLQFSLFGALGLIVGAADGLELNIMGLSLGFDLLRPALKLPLIGRVGMKDAPPFYRSN